MPAILGQLLQHLPQPQSSSEARGSLSPAEHRLQRALQSPPAAGAHAVLHHGMPNVPRQRPAAAAQQRAQHMPAPQHAQQQGPVQPHTLHAQHHSSTPGKEATGSAQMGCATLMVGCRR